MNIIEAIKSGKPLRRQGWLCDYDWVLIKENLFKWINDRVIEQVDAEDIIADDWEVLVCEKHSLVAKTELDYAHFLDHGCNQCHKQHQESLAADQCQHRYGSNEFGIFCVQCGIPAPKNIECLFDKPKSNEIVCQCGADSINSGGHSPWCPKA